MLFLSFSNKTIAQNELLKIDGIKFINDSTLDYKLLLQNISHDSLVLPIDYFQIELIFLDTSITRLNKITIKLLFPESNFNELTYYEQEQIIKKNCRPYVESDQFVIIGPNKYYELNSNLTSNGFAGFKRSTEYTATVNIYVSEAIKEFCPMIWSGRIEGIFKVL